MKYTCNHPEKFENPNLCYILGLTRVFNFLVIENINFFILQSQTTIMGSIGAFVTQQAVIGLTQFYFAEIIGKQNKDKTRECFKPENGPLIEWRNKDHTFMELPFGRKVKRVIYKFLRMLFVVFLYYFEAQIYLFKNNFDRSAAMHAFHRKIGDNLNDFYDEL